MISCPRYQWIKCSQLCHDSRHEQHIPAIFRLIRKIAERTGVFPDGIYLRDVELDPYEYKIGGYADVFQGLFEGRTVAIKRLRMYVASSDDKVACHNVRITVFGSISHFHSTTDSRLLTSVLFCIYYHMKIFYLSVV
jgi:hypothetical protein